MPFKVLARILLSLLPLLMSGCASSPAPSVYVAQTQVEVPPVPNSMREAAQKAPDFARWLEEIYSSSMGRLGLSQPDSRQKQTSSGTP